MISDYFQRMQSMARFIYILTACLAGCLCARADIAEPPIAPSAGTSTQPPVAQPVDINNPPVAQPAVSPESTNAAPSSAPSLVILNPAATRFDGAMASFNAGNYADAVTAFSDFVRDFPADRRREEALYRLAESYRNLGRLDDALAAYTFEVKTYPDGPLRLSAELRRGVILFDSGKMSEAVPPLQKVASDGAGEAQEAAKYLLGRAFLATQREPDGRALLQALADAPTPGKYAGPAAQALAEIDDQESRFPEALSLWQKALAVTTDPTTQATIAARGGWSALGAKQLDVAETLFQTARRLDPSGGARKVANTGLLRILFQQKRYSEWVATYGAEKDRLLESGRSEILYDLGHAEFSLKHWAGAATAFDQYLREFGSEPNAGQAAYERFLAEAQLDRTKAVAAAEAYLKAWPQSPYRARVQLVEAQELSAEKNYAAAVSLWESLSHEKGDADWPHREILLELARSHDELRQWDQAATAYQAYLDDLANQPGGDRAAIARESLPAQARLAVCLQNSDQLAAATQAWQAVQSEAAPGSPEEEMALESLGLIYAKSGPSGQNDMAATFRALLEKFPQSPLRAMAAFSVGDSLFKNRDYAGAEKYLLEARDWDKATWDQAATQRLALGAYGMKDRDKALAYIKEYDALLPPTDPLARQAAALPAALYYWLAEEARKAGQWDEAENFYTRVTRHPAPGDLLAGAWWQLGQVQSQRKEWAAAVESYNRYRDLKAAAKDATVVLLALGRAQLGAGNPDAAKTFGQQALVQEPEGPNSAAARMLLAEAALAARSYAEAARMFATLAVLFDDPKITPQAMARAADAFAAAGDPASASDWRQKLAAKYPQYQPTPYL
jgi:TolA-binding protein